MSVLYTEKLRKLEQAIRKLIEEIQGEIEKPSSYFLDELQKIRLGIENLHPSYERHIPPWLIYCKEILTFVTPVTDWKQHLNSLKTFEKDIHDFREGLLETYEVDLIYYTPLLKVLSTEHLFLELRRFHLTVWDKHSSQFQVLWKKNGVTDLNWGPFFSRIRFSSFEVAVSYFLQSFKGLKKENPYLRLQRPSYSIPEIDSRVCSSLKMEFEEQGYLKYLRKKYKTMGNRLKARWLQYQEGVISCSSLANFTSAEEYVREVIGDPSLCLKSMMTRYVKETQDFRLRDNIQKYISPFYRKYSQSHDILGKFSVYQNITLSDILKD